MTGAAGSDDSVALLAVLADRAATDAERVAAREALVRLHLPLVHHCARRFAHRGEPLEDLVQVGTIGLLHAIDRFDASRGIAFSSYATPTIIGEIKRHFRDKGWAVRVPRRLQERRIQIRRATADLSQELGRSPTPRELAAGLDCTVEEIVEALDSAGAYATLPLDGAAEGLSVHGIGEALGGSDAELEHVDLRASLKPLIEVLPERERRILLLRFFRNLSQAEIAEEIGVSQMHVSRLLAHTLARLRESLGEPP